MAVAFGVQIPKPRGTGAARFFSQLFLGGPTRTQESSPTIQTTVTPIVNNNPDRVALVITNNSANNIFIAPSNQLVAINVGVPLSSGGGSMTLTVQNDFDLCSDGWNGIASTGPVVVYVLETLQDVIVPLETG